MCMHEEYLYGCVRVRARCKIIISSCGVFVRESVSVYVVAEFNLLLLFF